MLTPFAAFVALLPFALAQNNAELQVESIHAQFQAAYLVPDLLKSFDPVASLTLVYGGNEVAAGSPLTVQQTSSQPNLTVTAANSSVTLASTFTLALVDPGPIGGNFSQGQTRHWLVNGITIGDGGKLVFPDPTKATTAYGGPLPPENSGAHRYVFLLYAQPSSFAPQGDLATPGQPIALFDVNQYATASGLGPVVAGTYFTCEQGTAAPPTTTSAINSATLPAAQSSGNASTKTGTPTSTSAKTSSTGTGAAFVNTVSMKGAAALALLGVVLA